MSITQMLQVLIVNFHMQIDLERVRQWLRMDELLEKERQIRTSMVNRAGVLALMLHSTYNHEVMEQIKKVQQDQSSSIQDSGKKSKPRKF